MRDQFLEGIFRVHKPVALLNPADKEGEGITDPDTHLLAYKVNEDFSLSGILVENQFGQFLVNIDGAKRLLVPASKSLSGAPLPAPISDAHNVDHFLCYQIEEEESAPRIVSVQDQFNAAPKLFEIRHPRFLCNPVDKNGEGIKNEENDLLCFRVQPVEGEPIHERVSGIFLSDQFGEHEVDTQKERELCLPSTKTP